MRPVGRPAGAGGPLVDLERRVLQVPGREKAQRFGLPRAGVVVHHRQAGELGLVSGDEIGEHTAAEVGRGDPSPV